MGLQTISLVPNELYITLERVNLSFQKDTFLFITSHGFYRLNHPELVMLLGGYTHCPSSIIMFYRSLWRYTIENNCRLDQKDYTEFSSPILGVYSGFVYSNQPLPKYLDRIPSNDYLICIGIIAEELYYVKKYGTARILANLSRIHKYYPTPFWNQPKDTLKRNVFQLDKDSAGSVLDGLTLITWPNVYVYVENYKHLIMDIDIHTSPMEILQDLRTIKALSERELKHAYENLTISFAIKANLNSEIPSHICWRADAPPLHHNETGNVCIISKPGVSASSQLGGSFLAFAVHDHASLFKTLEDGFCLFLPPQQLIGIIDECIQTAESILRFFENPQSGIIRSETIRCKLNDGHTFHIRLPTESQLRYLFQARDRTTFMLNQPFKNTIHTTPNNNNAIIELSAVTLLSTQEEFKQRTSEDEHGITMQKIYLSLLGNLQKIYPSKAEYSPSKFGSSITSINMQSMQSNGSPTVSSHLYLKDHTSNDIHTDSQSNSSVFQQEAWMFEVIVTEDGQTGLRSFSSSKKQFDKKRRDFVNECLVYLNSKHSRHSLRPGPTLKCLLEFVVYR